MASGKTKNYGLNQWESADKVVRLDFNEDNMKIDAGMAENKAAAAAAQATADAAVAKAGSAWGPDNCPFVVGTYIGSGTSNTHAKTISLGFKPTLVLVQELAQDNYGANVALGIQGHNYIANTNSDLSVFELTDTGFVVRYHYYNSSFPGAPNLNYNGVTYVYVAFR